MSTTLDHQKGNKLWIHDAVPRNYSYHPFSSEVSGITPAGPGLPTVAMINSARLTGSFGAATAIGGSQSGGSDVDGGQRRQLDTKNLVAGAREVKTESHTLYHTPFYQNNGMC